MHHCEQLIPKTKLISHLESHMLDHKDEADHEAANAAHTGDEPQESVDVNTARQRPEIKQSYFNFIGGGIDDQNLRSQLQQS